jgi:ring-1,2-phenylacetyl-CoA epoxidase subunit PaaC
VSAVAAAAVALGDDALILSHRLAEWAGHAPVLEEEVALANVALDLLGQARALYALAGDEDELAFRRDAAAFRNVLLVEQPRGDFARTIARQLYFSLWQELLFERLAASGPAPLASVAARALPEVAYHRDHAVTWTLRLGDGTPVSHARMRRATAALWRYTGELFEPVPGLRGDLPGALRGPWLARLTEVLRAATLPVPDGPDRFAGAAGGGRRGVHGEPLGRLLAEMQHLHRSHPGARW